MKQQRKDRKEKKMQEILFRGKRLDNGEWIISGSIRQWKNGNVGLMTEYGMFKVDPETVSQYTGFTDKNGNKIFGNDILFTVYSEDLQCIQHVVWYNGGWAIQQGYFEPDTFHEDTARVAEVIGNFIDNSELLEEEK